MFAAPGDMACLVCFVNQFFLFILLSHHRCRPQRHCSRAARPGIPHLQPHPGLILHCSPAPRGPQEEMSDRWWAAIQRKHCTAAASLQWCSAVPVLIEHTQDTTYCALYWRQCWLSCGVRLSEHPPREQTVTTSLHQSSYVDSLMLRALIRTVPGKGGGRNTETEATMRVWHEGLQKLRLFLFMQWLMRMITDDAMKIHFGLRLLDRAADHTYCHNYPGVNQARELRHLQCWSSN